MTDPTPPLPAVTPATVAVTAPAPKTLLDLRREIGAEWYKAFIEINSTLAELFRHAATWGLALAALSGVSYVVHVTQPAPLLGMVEVKDMVDVGELVSFGGLLISMIIELWRRFRR